MYFLLAATAFQSHFRDEKMKMTAMKEGGKDGSKVRVNGS